MGGATEMVRIGYSLGYNEKKKEKCPDYFSTIRSKRAFGWHG
jgi:hypothetical protein